MQAGQGNGASESFGHPSAQDIEGLAVPQGSSNNGGCSVAQDRATEPAAKDKTEVLHNRDEATDLTEATQAEKHTAADLLMLLANSHQEKLSTASGFQSARRTDEGDVDELDLNMTTASVAEKQPSQPEQISASYNSSELDCSSLAAEPSLQDAKKLRKYTKNARAQHDRLLEKTRDSLRATYSCLTACKRAHFKLSRDSSFAAFLKSKHPGCDKLKRALAATSQYDRTRSLQQLMVLWGIQNWFHVPSWDEWDKEVESLGGDISSMTKEIMDSGFFDQPPKEVKSVFREFPLVSYYTMAARRHTEAIETGLRLHRELAAFCDRKRSLLSTFVDWRQYSMFDSEAFGVDAWAMTKLISQNSDFLSQFERMVGMEINNSTLMTIYDHYPILRNGESAFWSQNSTELLALHGRHTDIAWMMPAMKVEVKTDDSSSEKDESGDEENLDTVKGAEVGEETGSEESLTLKAETEETSSEEEEVTDRPPTN